MRDYEFTTADGETCSFRIAGENADGSRDVDVSCGGYSREWDGVDAGSAEDMFADLLASGIRFETGRSLVANVMTVASVMLDGDMTFHGVLALVDAMSDREVDDKLDLYFGTTEVTA